MAALNFPTSPSINDTYTANGKTWTWDGTEWASTNFINLATDVSGVLPVANGGTGTSTAFTTGSVVFAGASGVYAQDNAKFFWDNTNDFLGLGTAVPVSPLHVHVADNVNVNARITNSTTGATAGDGFEWGIEASGPIYFWNYENQRMYFGTNNIERMVIGAAGTVAIGKSIVADRKLAIGGNGPAATANYFGVYVDEVAQSGTTAEYASFLSQSTTAAASFTLTALTGFVAADFTKGAGSTITSQRGFTANDQTQGTNNYGFVSGVSAGTNKWNFYGSGTANNAHAGLSRFGSTTVPTSPVDVTGPISTTSTTITGDTTITVAHSVIINNKSGSSCTLTLPAANTCEGREYHVLNWQAQALVSASSNVVPKVGGAATTAILPATDGAWATIKSDGSNWNIIRSGT